MGISIYKNGLAASLLALVVLATPAAAQQAQPQAQPQQNVERTTNGAWTVECVQNEQNQRLCRMVQNVNDPKTQKPLLQVVVAKPQGAPDALLTVIAPLGVWIRPGLTLNVDGGAANQLNFEFCLKEGCLARMRLPAGTVSALQRGSAANISLQNIRRQKIDLKVSLSGFTASYGAL